MQFVLKTEWRLREIWVVVEKGGKKMSKKKRIGHLGNRTPGPRNTSSNYIFKDSLNMIFARPNQLSPCLVCISLRGLIKS